METKPIQHSDLSFLVYERIKDMILSGKLAPGEKLPQEKIASMLGVSRMPLHKAFVMLEDEFLVESIPRRGIFIRKTDLKEIIEAFECREGLEGIAARKAALNLKVREIDQLENLFKEFSEKNLFEPVKYQRADQQFHETIISASGNNVLKKLNNIGNLLIRTYPRGIILPYEESLTDHYLIINAFRNRNSEEAENLIRNHSNKAKKILENQLKEQI